MKKDLEQQLNNFRECIVERARMYLTDCNNLEIEEIEASYELYELEMTSYPVSMYDYEDSINHAFDLGGYYTIKNLISTLNANEQQLEF